MSGSEGLDGARPASARPAGYPKRLFDFVAAAGALLLLSPLLLIVGLVILVALGWPVLFIQRRPGLHGQPFPLVKFRTMLKDEPGSPRRSDAERLTHVGRLLRATSLDELPELWNVLKGEMSLVGPRPLLMHYLGHYSSEQMRRHHVRPGLTGWAQVNGRNAIGWDAKFALDVWYVDNLSFRLDMKILLLTLGRVAGRGGISAEGSATMPEFAPKPPEPDG